MDLEQEMISLRNDNIITECELRELQCFLRAELGEGPRGPVARRPTLSFSVETEEITEERKSGSAIKIKPLAPP